MKMLETFQPKNFSLELFVARLWKSAQYRALFDDGTSWLYSFDPRALICGRAAMAIFFINLKPGWNPKKFGEISVKHIDLTDS